MNESPNEQISAGLRAMLEEFLTMRSRHPQALTDPVGIY